MILLNFQWSLFNSFKPISKSPCEIIHESWYRISPKEQTVKYIPIDENKCNNHSLGHCLHLPITKGNIYRYNQQNKVGEAKKRTKAIPVQQLSSFFSIIFPIFVWTNQTLVTRQHKADFHVGYMFGHRLSNHSVNECDCRVIYYSEWCLVSQCNSPVTAEVYRTVLE